MHYQYLSLIIIKSLIRFSPYCLKYNFVNEIFKLNFHMIYLIYFLDNLTLLSSYALIRKFDTGLHVQYASFKLYGVTPVKNFP